jgi:predicted PurR-regulated permease PerM
MADLMVGAFGGAVSAAGMLVDAIVVLSLAIFMAIDRESIQRLGLDLTPPEKREDVLLFRRSVGTAFAGFIRSQLILGALYGVWALLVSLVFGLPFGPATAFLTGLIMAIPIYGPYVSWLPVVLVALFVRPDVVIIVAILMLVGWFIDRASSLRWFVGALHSTRSSSPSRSFWCGSRVRSVRSSRSAWRRSYRRSW